jgi:putative peptidoglycan lipid II flippase
MVNHAKRLLNRANANQTVTSATLFISGAYLGSRLLGLLRDRLLVAHFGAGPEASAYNAAFRIPELMFSLLVSGAFAVAFIPVLSAHLQKDERDKAWQVTSSLLNLLVIATIAGGVLILIFADPLTRIISPGFDQPMHDLTVNLTRIMAITPMLFAISSVLGSVQQAFNRFVIFSLAGVLYNIGIIIGILTLSNHYGIYGAAWGVVLGVVLQALLQWLGLYGLGFKYRPELNLKLTGVRTTLKLMWPRSINQGIDQINYSVETIIGSTIITTAIVPRLAARASGGQQDKLIEAYVSTARLILFLAVPSALFSLIARGYIVRLLYGFGDLATANTLGWFSGTIVFSSLFMLVSRVYYAMQDTRTPLYLSLGSIPLNILLSFVFSHQYGVTGLAMSASVVAALETVTLIFILRLRHGRFGEGQILAGAWRMIFSASIMLGILYLLISQFFPLYANDHGFFTLMPKFVLIVGVAIVTYLVPCYLLRLKEAKHVARRVREVLTKQLNLT